LAQNEPKELSYSIIIPTYTGQDVLPRCLDSLQAAIDYTPGVEFEIVVVIDGPNPTLRDIVIEKKTSFLGVSSFKVHQFKENKGRFLARLKGAELAKFDRLVFIDDRVQIDKHYFKALQQLNDQIIIPQVIENHEKITPIALTLNKLRKHIYGPSWGGSFKDYEITAKNFDRAPKGTGSIIFPKKIFIEACSTLSDKNSKYISDDTKILKAALEKTVTMLRTNKIKIFYNPRTSYRQQVVHLYERGPRFVNYYYSPDKPYFLPLNFFLFGLLVLIFALIFYPMVLAVVLPASVIVLFVLSLWLNNWRVSMDVLFIIGGMLSIGIAFGAGLIKGFFVKALGK